MSRKAEEVVRELDALRATLCAVGVVGVIEGYSTIRRESVLELVDRARAEIGSMAQTAHKEQPSSYQVPAGWKLVPTKPTAEMKAACRVAGKLRVWEDMVSAAPTPPLTNLDSATDVIDVHQHHVGIRIDSYYYGLDAVRRALAAEHQRLLASRSPEGQPGEENRCSAADGLH
ncbi:hypothetical protein CBM2633_U10090 [Cupriavidus taiwanensis]|uniref:hypothetical protein n=1 Tax=Cupriavidus taiwanensis TaxID=164546 RepID=UPI000E161569|nr:hypothetical protein [Cupriavidus taiwanensis]SPA23746.1 hypothetical protein CBM2633_U10090 [Cupriavidus taiwanensis]